MKEGRGGLLFVCIVEEEAGSVTLIPYFFPKQEDGRG
jgi:hypothetical protein